MTKKIINIGFTVLSLLIFILSIYILVFGTIAKNNNKLLNMFGYSVSVVPTNSMEGNAPDSIKQGAFIITKNVAYDSIEIGDIIVFQDSNLLKVHRVVDIKIDGLITKGDNPNAVIDPIPIKVDTYQAKVVYSFTFFGVGTYIPGMQLLVLFLLMVFLFVLLIIQIIKIMKIKHDEKLNQIKQEVNR